MTQRWGRLRSGRLRATAASEHMFLRVQCVTAAQPSASSCLILFVEDRSVLLWGQDLELQVQEKPSPRAQNEKEACLDHKTPPVEQWSLEQGAGVDWWSCSSSAGLYSFSVWQLLNMEEEVWWSGAVLLDPGLGLLHLLLSEFPPVPDWWRKKQNLWTPGLSALANLLLVTQRTQFLSFTNVLDLNSYYFLSLDWAGEGLPCLQQCFSTPVLKAHSPVCFRCLPAIVFCSERLLVLIYKCHLLNTWFSFLQIQIW